VHTPEDVETMRRLRRREITDEEVCLHAYENAREATAGVGRYFDFSNEKRPHQALVYQNPAAFSCAELRKAA
jgi:hypothetical protein